MSDRIAPLVRPMRSWEVNNAGSWTARTRSRTSRSAVSATAIRDDQVEDFIPSITAAERVLVASPVDIQGPHSGTGDRRRSVPRSLVVPVDRLHLAGIDGALVLELAVLDLLDGELRQRSITVLVEAPRAEDAVVVLGGEDLLQHRLAGNLSLLGGPLYGIEHHVGRLVSVGGVGLDIIVVPALVFLGELLTLGGELALRQPSEGDVDSLCSRSGLGEECVDEDAVGSDKEDVVVAHAGPDLVLEELGGVVLYDATEVDGVGVLLGDLVHHRAEVGRGGIDTLTADDLYTEFFGALLDLVGEPLAVGLFVVEYVDGLHAFLFHQEGARLALLVVGHDHTGVVALARRVVLLRLVRLTTGLGQADVGVRRADHAEPGLVEDRDLDRRTTGVE